MQSTTPAAPQSDLDRYILARKKSVGGAFVLALFFGPVGALYGSPLGGVILLLLALGAGALAPPLLLLIWLVAMALGPWGAERYNLRVATEAALLVRR